LKWPSVDIGARHVPGTVGVGSAARDVAGSADRPDSARVYESDARAPRRLIQEGTP